MLEYIRYLLSRRAARDAADAAVFGGYPFGGPSVVPHATFSAASLVTGCSIWLQLHAHHPEPSTTFTLAIAAIFGLAVFADVLYVNTAGALFGLLLKNPVHVVSAEPDDAQPHNHRMRRVSAVYRRLQRGWNLVKIWRSETGPPLAQEDAEAIRHYAFRFLQSQIAEACDELRQRKQLCNQAWPPRQQPGNPAQQDPNDDVKSRAAQVDGESHPSILGPVPVGQPVPAISTDPTNAPADAEESELLRRAIAYLYSGRALSDKLPRKDVPELVNGDDKVGEAFAQDAISFTDGTTQPQLKASHRLAWWGLHATRVAFLLAMGGMAASGAAGMAARIAML